MCNFSSHLEGCWSTFGQNLLRLLSFQCFLSIQKRSIDSGRFDITDLDDFPAERMYRETERLLSDIT